MMIEYKMSEENEKSCLYYQLMINQRIIVFRIILINHEFFMNSIIINQNIEISKKE